MAQPKKTIRIAILGAGISGCASAYFLNQLFKENAEITVFEKTERAGGRLLTYEYNGRNYEIGGSILHTSNIYMAKFAEILGLKPKDLDKSKQTATAMFDATGPVFVSNGGFIDQLRVLGHFGVYQFIRFRLWLNSMLKDFVKIYKLQDNGFTFTNLEQFLTKLGPRLYQGSQTSLRESMVKQGFSRNIIDHLANIACLANYCQSNEIDGFVGLVSLAGTDGDLWAVKNGNYQVPKGLLEKSGAKVLWNTRVKSVSQTSTDSAKNVIVYEDGQTGNEVTDDTFDYVLVGFPVFDQVPTDTFNLEFKSAQELRDRQMKQVNTYIIEGSLKLFPQLPTDKRLQCLSVDPSVPYRTIATQLPCDYSQKSDADLYVKEKVKLFKVFSEKVLSSDDLNDMFEPEYKIVQYIPWLAYPKYNEKPTSKSIPDVILDAQERSRVFYLNSLEWSASCMEICSISARNVSMLIAKREKDLQAPGTTKRSRSFFTNYEPLNLNAKKDQARVHTVSKYLSILALIGIFWAIFFSQGTTATTPKPRSTK